MTMKRRHELAIARKGHYPSLRTLGDEHCAVDTGCLCRSQQREIDRIAIHLAFPFRPWLRPAGKGRDFERRHHGRIPDHRLISHGDVATGRPQPHECHQP